MGNLENVNAKELGEVVDMIKDLSECEYYCSIVEAMEKSDKERTDQDKITAAISSATSERNYYSMRYPMRPYYYGGEGGNSMGYGSRNYYYDPNIHGYTDGRGYRDGMGYTDQMYYTERSGVTDGRDRMRNGYDGSGSNGYSISDQRYMGRSPMLRRSYMEAKENHMDDTYKKHKLENFLDGMVEDAGEMLASATPEEKKMWKEKLTMLNSKLG